MKLFVTGLPSNFDEVDLKEMFELYGDVDSAKVIIDFKTKKSKGFGFIEMPNDVEATAVIGILSGKKISGKKLIINKAEERPEGAAKPPRTFTPRSSSNNNYRNRY